jgi:ankyrin repeat protein
MYGHAAVVKALLKHGADARAVTLHEAAYNGHAAVVEALLKHGVYVDAEVDLGWNDADE